MMKRLMFFCFMLSGLWTQAQIEKGSVMVGGSAGFQFRKVDKTTTDLQFSIAPNVLYSVINNWPLAVSFHLRTTTTSEPNLCRLSCRRKMCLT
jgi:hypothetical protein